MGTLWGGPAAAIYFIHRNFTALGRAQAARNTLVVGVALGLAFLLTLPFLPENFPSLLIPLAYSLIALLVVVRWQPSSETIAMDSRYDFQSGWRVFFITLIALALTILIAVVIMLGLSGLGLLDLR